MRMDGLLLVSKLPLENAVPYSFLNDASGKPPLSKEEAMDSVLCWAWALRQKALSGYSSVRT